MQLVHFVPALILAAVAACGSEPATSGSSTATALAPNPGWLTVQLTTPNNNDGAVQLAVTGPLVDSVIIVGYDGFAARSDDVVDILVDGQITNGELARIHVPDVTRVSEYQASVVAAAARDSYQLQLTQGYRAVIAP